MKTLLPHGNVVEVETEIAMDNLPTCIARDSLLPNKVKVLTFTDGEYTLNAQDRVLFRDCADLEETETALDMLIKSGVTLK